MSRRQSQLKPKRQLPRLSHRRLKKKLKASDYEGTIVYKEIPLVEFALEIFNDPKTLKQMTAESDEEWTVECENIDLSDPEVKQQFEETIDTVESVINKDIPLKIMITESNNGYAAVIMIDYEDAFPDQECETSEDTFEVEHSPGKVTFSLAKDEEGVIKIFIFEGVILNNGDMEGTFAITVDSDEYEEYSGTSTIFSGNWSV